MTLDPERGSHSAERAETYPRLKGRATTERRRSMATGSSQSASLLSTPAGTDPDDPWLVSNGPGYDRKKLYTRASDGRGHSELIHIKISEGIAAALREAVEHVPGYKTKADVIRDAVTHRLHEINTWPTTDPLKLQKLQHEIVQEHVDTVNRNIRQWRETLEETDTTVSKLIDDGDYETALFLLDQAGRIDYMTEPWLLRYGAMIHKHRERLRYWKPEGDDE